MLRGDGPHDSARRLEPGRVAPPPNTGATDPIMFATPAFAQSAGASAPGVAGQILGIAPLVLIFIAFYFLMIRPQQKRMKVLQTALANIKKNDTVVTAGGLVGKVTRVDDRHVEVEIAPNVRVRVVKATIAEVTPLGGKPAND